MAENENKHLNSVKVRLATIRLRTWTLTLAIVFTLIFYFLVNLTTKQAINPIDFGILCAVQIMVHSLYFPDGELFGQKDSSYISNKGAYNDKATDINLRKRFGRLREYCDVEYEERKRRYFLTELSRIGIEEEEFYILKQKSEEEIKKLKSYEFKSTNKDGEEESKVIFFTKAKRKWLFNLIFKELPVEKNQPETIMSAVENNRNKAIRDGSISYKAHSYVRKILLAIILGGTFAYIGYTLRDGFGIAELTSVFMYLTTLFSTAVMSYSNGETCSKVHKSRFYLDLSNFIDAFNEWDTTQKKESN